jgi:hypothetical protein
MNLYSYSVAYEVESQVVAQIMGTAASALPGGAGLAGGSLSIIGSSGSLFTSKYVSFGIILPIMSSLTSLLTSLSAMYMGVFSTLVTLATGMLFLQYLLLVLMQYTAFTTILPIAILMRSIAFAGGHLRQSANAVLAIAIAAYLVYPLTVAFDSYMMNFALANAGKTNALQNININAFFTSSSYTGFSGASLVLNSLPYLVNPFNIMSQAQSIVNRIAQFLFQAIVLFAINVAITIGFATGLAKALNSGVEGAGSFWQSI